MPTRVSFASFNLYNFQAVGERTHGIKHVTPEHYNKQLDWTVNKIKQIDADVIAFQELWHKSCLDDVVALLPNYRAYYIAPSWYKTAVAFMVRKPWQAESSEVIKAFPFQQIVKSDNGDGEDDDFTLHINQFSRSVLKLTIRSVRSKKTPLINVYACHFKSKLPVIGAGNTALGSAMSTIRRTAEAAALRMILDEHMTGEGTPTVVIGDLNDDPLSNTLNILTTQPTMTKRSRGGDKALYSTLFFEQLKSFRDVFYTHEHKNHLGVLDHVLVSEEFFEHSKDSVWEHSNTTIWNDHVQDGLTHTTDHGIVKASFT